MCRAPSSSRLKASLPQVARTVFIRGLLVVILMAVGGTGSLAQTDGTALFRTDRLSERVLLLTEISPMENIVVAVATQMGLVLVDATGSPYTAGLLRSVVEETFGRDDFAYLIQTHYHWDHAWGNSAFPEAMVVAHEGARAVVEADRTRLADILPRRRENLQELETQLLAMGDGSPERGALEERRDFQARSVRGMEGGFDIRDPDITFTDRLSLDLGDVTLDLTFFGRAHSGNDVLILIPEEEMVLTGDLFLDVGWLPLFAGQPVLDIPRWIDVLGLALDGEAEVSSVIPGHREAWSREKLDLWRGYIVDLWEGVNLTKAEGATLEDALARFPLPERFLYLRELGHTDEELNRFQRENVEAFWRQISEQGASLNAPALRLRMRQRL